MIGALVKKSRIRLLKARLRSLSRAIHNHYARFDCGIHLADHISPVGPQLKAKFAEQYERLRELDPEAPERMR
ncbi:hypothetical protein JYP52_21440 [Nitratireductor aquibiodomus]|uniref:hypothetical protein n=1 Tax=Nitratireductor aquibiodomus TaxID=204799 RepID=UPI000DDD1133|nr:hypothetical protein [Nitratireductor aquibiodomus]MBN7763706.1 hypothetical protein [Nitratireductor aquibiodomus]